MCFIDFYDAPFSYRFHCKNIILWGVWQGRGKPQTITFMLPFVETMKDLAAKGIFCLLH